MINNKIPDDEAIKSLVLEFQKGNASLEDVTETLGWIIYNFPKSVSHLKTDACGDFFLYIHERLEKILKCYTLQKTQFKRFAQTD